MFQFSVQKEKYTDKILSEAKQINSVKGMDKCNFLQSFLYIHTQIYFKSLRDKQRYVKLIVFIYQEEALSKIAYNSCIYRNDKAFSTLSINNYAHDPNRLLYNLCKIIKYQ